MTKPDDEISVHFQQVLLRFSRIPQQAQAPIGSSLARLMSPIIRNNAYAVPLAQRNGRILLPPFLTSR